MSTENPENPTSVYDFMVKDTYDNDIPLDKYEGKVLLIVNIASRCGHTKKNYEGLTELNELYKDKGLFQFCPLHLLIVRHFYVLPNKHLSKVFSWFERWIL